MSKGKNKTHAMTTSGEWRMDNGEGRMENGERSGCRVRANKPKNDVIKGIDNKKEAAH